MADPDIVRARLARPRVSAKPIICAICSFFSADPGTGLGIPARNPASPPVHALHQKRAARFSATVPSSKSLRPWARGVISMRIAEISCGTTKPMLTL